MHRSAKFSAAFVFVSVWAFSLIAFAEGKPVETSETNAPPNSQDRVAVARYIMHKGDQAYLGTLSTILSIKGYPYLTTTPTVDGTIAKSTGVPYFYLTTLGRVYENLSTNNSCSISVILDEKEYCSQNDVDPKDPKCSRVLLSGKMVQVDKNTDEHNFAYNALIERHPYMAQWPTDHHFYVAKLELTNIIVYDKFGHGENVPVTNYLAVSE